jgi:hypothetical protein
MTTNTPAEVEALAREVINHYIEVGNQYIVAYGAEIRTVASCPTCGCLVMYSLGDTTLYIDRFEYHDEPDHHCEFCHDHPNTFELAHWSK